MRIGFASDIHRLVEGRKLVLAGVEIPSSLGELAHTDGDVVYHALSEAILGALALGDLGKFFPGTPKFKDMDSSKIVDKIVQMMLDKNYQINNIDISITLEKPKLASYIPLMRENIAKLLKTSVNNVSVKAGTNEGIDEIGKGLAVKAEAIVLLKEKEA
ncbi:MAG TPA: 2-C-methyl-D-erythritol 2,4-cyclodiphosphate synthase [Erysipelotrichaceae bacterium]|nr:2-C-methyl-D-erythritol 2,4-cyclodiphosphate synthase [Erysipelotrichaceae bacterium]